MKTRGYHAVHFYSVTLGKGPGGLYKAPAREDREKHEFRLSPPSYLFQSSWVALAQFSEKRSRVLVHLLASPYCFPNDLLSLKKHMLK